MRTIFKNVGLFDGTGVPVYKADVAVHGNRIEAVGPAATLQHAPDETVIDGTGLTLMPGLVEAHSHLCWPSSTEQAYEGLHLPPDEMRIATWRNARILLDHGFTSAYSAGALTNTIEVELRDEINAGLVPGPRLKASTIERAPDAEGDAGRFVTDIDNGQGPAAMRAFMSEVATLNVDSVKFLISGEDALSPGSSQVINYSEEELAVADEMAKRHGIWFTGHTHAAASIKLAVRNGFRALYHCEMADVEALDMMEEARDRIFVAPSIGVVIATLEVEASFPGLEAMKENARIVLERSSALMPELRRRGIRVLPGGDYGFPFNPNGRNARDLEHFVTHFGYTPADALVAATRMGGQLMGMDDELGLVKPGYLADLLLIDRDPTQDVRILQDAQRILMVMKNGETHKMTVGRKADARTVG